MLDVIRDPRWGRVDECIAEDPYVVGTLGTSYVRGLQSTGVHATLKHFVGYSASQSGRNFAPVHAGPREVEDVLLVPFEMALLDGGARSVMSSYTEIDGVPVAADPRLLTGVLRDRWGFDGTVVADYFGVAFLQILHAVAGDLGEAAGLALAAGVDIELPTGDAYLGAARRGGPRRAGRRGARRPGRPARPAAEGGARAARRDLRRRAADDGRPRQPRAPRARAPGWPRSRSCCCPTTARCRWPTRRASR